MWIKAIKRHYNIWHFVTLEENGNVNIGSPYIHDIIVVNPKWEIIKDYNSDRTNADLYRYAMEIKSLPSKFVELYNEDDRVGKLTVYSHNGIRILEDSADAVGYPNVTDSGQLQYENSHWPTYEEARAHLMRELWYTAKGSYAKYDLLNNFHEIIRHIKYASYKIWRIIRAWPLLAYHYCKRR